MIVEREADMGMFIGNRNDLETAANLNAAFTSDQLKALHKHKEKKGTLFDGNHKLSRVAFRLKAYPSDPNIRLKWFGLLDHIEQNHPAARDKIKNTLQSAINNYPAVQRVVFGVKHNPAGTGYSADADTSTAVYALTLVCSGDYTGPSLRADPPPDEDSGGNNVERPLSSRARTTSKKRRPTKRKTPQRTASKRPAGKSGRRAQGKKKRR